MAAMKAYGKAQTALKENEELTFSDGEIDAFLPAPLRRTRCRNVGDSSSEAGI
jgi:hypothetical protein